jgi:hypothetical protein
VCRNICHNREAAAVCWDRSTGQDLVLQKWMQCFQEEAERGYMSSSCCFCFITGKKGNNLAWITLKIESETKVCIQGIYLAKDLREKE